MSQQGHALLVPNTDVTPLTQTAPGGSIGPNHLGLTQIAPAGHGLT